MIYIYRVEPLASMQVAALAIADRSTRTVFSLSSDTKALLTQQFYPFDAGFPQSCRTGVLDSRALGLDFG